MASLADGSLESLFGWEEVDLAAYLRDTIAPLLDHEDLNVFVDGIPPESRLPLTHVFLQQISFALDVQNLDGECGGGSEPDCADAEDPGLCQVQLYAQAWGIPLDGSGTFRYSHIRGFTRR